MNPSLLCETVTGATMAELVAARDATAADMVELRLDGVAEPDVAHALQNRRTPTIVTCRPRWEGGRFDGSEEERGRLLAEALARGAEYVDVEWRAGFDDLIREHAPRVVVSSHDFVGVPDDLCARARAMRATGAAVIKVAITASRLSDTLPLLDIAKGGDAVVIGMGDAGVPSRLLAARFGSRWTYGGHGVAPGQVPAAVVLVPTRELAVQVADDTRSIAEAMSDSSATTALTDRRAAIATSSMAKTSRGSAMATTRLSPSMATGTTRRLRASTSGTRRTTAGSMRWLARVTNRRPS